jgi:hypothetical protein
MRRLFQRIKSASEMVGAFLTLFGLPAAILGAIAFSGEIVDSFTAPDVVAKIETMTLRCFYRFRDQSEYNAYIGGDVQAFVVNCDAAPLAVSFTAEVTNEDRIRRTLTGFSAELSLPLENVADPLAFALTWEVAHEIRGTAETNIRRNWYTVELSPSRTTRHEVWIEPDEPEGRALKWDTVRNWLDDPAAPAAGAAVEARVYLHLAGLAERRLVSTCRFRFAPDALERFRALAMVRQLQFTAKCAA